MDTYDTVAMKSISSDINSEVTKFESAKQEIDGIVQKLGSNMKNDTNTQYVQKYEKEAKEAAENVAKLMKQFASFLDAMASGVDHIEDDAKSKM